MRKRILFLLSGASFLSLLSCVGKTEVPSDSSLESASSEVVKESHSISSDLPKGIQIDVLSEAKEGDVLTLTLIYDENAILVTKVLANNVECSSLGNKKYSFIMPNENVAIRVESEEKTNKYAISNGNAERVEIDAPSAQEAGKTVTFGYKVKPGYVLKDVQVTSNGKAIEIKDNKDGTYSFLMPKGDVIIQVNTKNRLYKISKDEGTSSFISLIKCNYTLDYVVDEEATSPKDEDIWSHDSKAEYSRLVTVTLTSRESLKPSGIIIPEMDNKEIALEKGASVLSFVMPNKDITIKVKTVADTHPVKFINSEHLSLSLFKKEGDAYSEISNVLASEKNYLKVTASKDTFKVAKLTYTYTPASYGKDQTIALTDENLKDGYYEVTIPNMKEGTSLSFEVTEKEGGKYANYSFVGSYFGSVMEKGDAEEVQWPTDHAINIDDSGYFTMDSKTYQIESASGTQKGNLTIKDENGQTFAMYFDGNSLLADASFASNGIVGTSFYFAYRKSTDTPSYVRDMYRGYVDSVELDSKNWLTSFQLVKKGKADDFSDASIITRFVADTRNGYFVLGNNIEFVLTEGKDPINFSKAYQSYNILVDGELKYALKQTGKYSPKRSLLDQYYGNYKLSSDAETTLILDGEGNATYNGLAGYAYVVDGNTLTLSGNGKKITLTIDVAKKTYVFVKEETMENPLLGTKWSDNGEVSFTDDCDADNYCGISLEFTSSTLCHLSWIDEYYEEYGGMEEYVIIEEDDYPYTVNGNSVKISATHSNNAVSIELTLSSDGNKLIFDNEPSNEKVKGKALTKAK